MLEYERINILEWIDVNKTNLSKECDICLCWYFKNIGYKYEPHLFDLMQKTMSVINIATVYVKGNAYRIHFWYMSKDDAINIIHGSVLLDKRGVLQNIFYYI